MPKFKDITGEKFNYLTVIEYKGRDGKTKFKLHRFLTNCPEGYDVDHINHHVNDNRKSNLRICTRSQNNMNRKGKGVCWCKARNKWTASITKDNKKYFLGYYDNYEEALKVRKKQKKNILRNLHIKEKMMNQEFEIDDRYEQSFRQGYLTGFNEGMKAACELKQQNEQLRRRIVILENQARNTVDDVDGEFE